MLIIHEDANIDCQKKNETGKNLCYLKINNKENLLNYQH